MAVEIERKFLVADDAWRTAVSHSTTMAQGYLAGPPAARCSVRVRVAGGDAWLSVKSLADGVTRDEYEYPIPPDHAHRMLATLAGDIVAKRCHHVAVGTHLFEIDEFEGANHGLLVAEIELDAVDEAFPRPDWLGPEVSHLARYYNMNLATRPYRDWNETERNAPDAE
jgi:adenylate cyclase